MIEPLIADLSDLEAPPADAVEQSVPVDRRIVDQQLLGSLPDDLEVPVPDAIEQHYPASPYEDEDWR